MANFVPYEYEQPQWLTVDFSEQILPGTFEFVVHTLIEARVEDSLFASRYHNQDGGRPAIPPKLLLKAVLYGYSLGLNSSRKLEHACQHNITFIALTAGIQPDHSTFASFISRLGDQIADIFAKVLVVCDEEGLLAGTHFAVDGLKLSTNAAKEWSGTFEELRKKAEKFRRKAKALLDDHHQRDQRLARSPGVATESHSAAQKLLNKADKIDTFLAENQPRIGEAGKEIKSNITDPDSSKMHTGGATTQGYNCQALTEGSHQVVTHADLAAGGQDGKVLTELLDRASETAEKAGLGKHYYQDSELLADANYHSEANLESCESHGIDAVIPDPNYRDRDARYAGRDKHIGKARPKKKTRFDIDQFVYNEEEDSYTCPQGERLGLITRASKNQRGTYRTYGFDRRKQAPCATCPLKEQCVSRNRKSRTVSVRTQTANPRCERMRAYIDTPEAKRRYSYRMGTVEPVFANITSAKRLHRIHHRGREKVNIVWTLYCLMHNISRLVCYRPQYGC